MNKKASIKIALRRALEKRAGQSVTISRPSADSASINLGAIGLQYTFSEHDDNGDTATDEQHDEIYAELETIVAEHNA